tara:strand:- start:198 stop:707 length:510 start_codon:yes stop_codon:yes gene_type:complete
MEELKKNLAMAEIIRIILTIFVLYYLPIPLFYKIILVMLFEGFDYTIPKKLLKIDWIDSSNINYHIYDKIGDKICYSILLLYIIQNKIFPKSYSNILIYLLIFRIIGTVLFILKKNRDYLFYFPNFFLEITLAFSGLKHFVLNNSIRNLIIPIIITLKIIQEYFMHYNK